MMAELKFQEEDEVNAIISDDYELIDIKSQSSDEVLREILVHHRNNLYWTKILVYICGACAAMLFTAFIVAIVLSIKTSNYVGETVGTLEGMLMNLTSFINSTSSDMTKISETLQNDSKLIQQLPGILH